MSRCQRTLISRSSMRSKKPSTPRNTNSISSPPRSRRKESVDCDECHSSGQLTNRMARKVSSRSCAAREKNVLLGILSQPYGCQKASRVAVGRQRNELDARAGAKHHRVGSACKKLKNLWGLQIGPISEPMSSTRASRTSRALQGGCSNDSSVRVSTNVRGNSA